MQLNIFVLGLRRNPIHRREYHLSLFLTHAAPGSRSRRHATSPVI
jgi:hypothetical protein